MEQDLIEVQNKKKRIDREIRILETDLEGTKARILKSAKDSQTNHPLKKQDVSDKTCDVHIMW